MMMMAIQDPQKTVNGVLKNSTNVSIMNHIIQRKTIEQPSIYTDVSTVRLMLGINYKMMI
jgi:hypothetical protein